MQGTSEHRFDLVELVGVEQVEGCVHVGGQRGGQAFGQHGVGVVVGLSSSTLAEGSVTHGSPPPVLDSSTSRYPHRGEDVIGPRGRRRHRPPRSWVLHLLQGDVENCGEDTVVQREVLMTGHQADPTEPVQLVLGERTDGFQSVQKAMRGAQRDRQSRPPQPIGERGAEDRSVDTGEEHRR